MPFYDNPKKELDGEGEENKQIGIQKGLIQAERRTGRLEL